MSLQQLSVFVENRPGSLVSVLKTLAGAKIDLNGLSVADTTEFGVLRLILSDPARGEEVLQEAGFIVKATDVLAIDVNDTPGGLFQIADMLSSHGLNIEYMYAFGTKKDHHAMIIFKTEDNRKAADILKDGGVHVLDSQEVYERLYS
ncbi:MAG: ACT domain-containing protein [Lachnospirales bacterium]